MINLIHNFFSLCFILHHLSLSLSRERCGLIFRRVKHVCYLFWLKKWEEMNEWCDDERGFYLKTIWVKCIAMMILDDDALGYIGSKFSRKLTLNCHKLYDRRSYWGRAKFVIWTVNCSVTYIEASSSRFYIINLVSSSLFNWITWKPKREVNFLSVRSIHSHSINAAPCGDQL